MPKRIFVYSNTAWSIYNFRRNLILDLLAKGHEVIAVAPPDEVAERISELGCQFIPIPMDNKGTSILRDLKMLLQIRKILKQHQPDIAFTFTIKCNIYTCFASILLPTLVIPNVSGLGTAFLSKGWLNKLVCLLYRLAFRKSSTVFFQNENDQALFEQLNLVKSSQIHLLPGSGVNLQYFAPSEMAQNENVTFLLLARLLWNKGIGEYVSAAKKIKKKYPATSFQLLGFLDVVNSSAIKKDTIDSWVRDGILDYLGATNDVRPYIKHADCIVLPSYYPEGTPRSLLEAAAMARPIITTNTPGCRNTVNNEVSGFLCQPKNVDDLAAALEKIVVASFEDRQKMGRQARILAEKEFDEKIVLKAYADAIK